MCSDLVEGDLPFFKKADEKLARDTDLVCGGLGGKSFIFWCENDGGTLLHEIQSPHNGIEKLFGKWAFFAVFINKSRRLRPGKSCK